jgi:1-acyl-sn-glycerol-3-phosphate acyltransferase
VKRLIHLLGLYAFHIGFVRPVLYLVLGASLRRRGMVPRGPCIVVANHNSHLDAAILMSLFPLRRLHRVHPVAAADYFGKNAFLRTMAMMFMNGIPIERRHKGGEDPLAGVVSALERGESMIFFPEGSRGEAGVLAQFRPGIGKLVKTFPGLLVVPVFMAGPERIWARGQIVPVPTRVHASVGKPRTYPQDLDAREIADRVRQDVLSLAPPPPPIPGSRPSPPLRVAVCCVEPDLRRKVFLEVVRRLGSAGRAIGLSSPVLESDDTGCREAHGGIPVTLSLGWPKFLARLFRTGGLFKGYKFAEMVDRARLDEALEHDRSARFVVGEGNALVDLLAWAHAEFYEGRFEEKALQRLMLYLSGRRSIPVTQWWDFVRKAPEVWLLNTFDLARPPAPDVLVLVRLPVADAMTRIRMRGGPLEPFHTEDALDTLQRSYDEVAEAIRRRHKVVVVTEDGSRVSVDEIGRKVYDACAPMAEATAAGNDG